MNVFRLGQRYCLTTGNRVADCEHCAKVIRSEGSTGPALIVTKIDHEAGTITLSAERRPKARA